jgi:hypothetical protein
MTPVIHGPALCDHAQYFMAAAGLGLGAITVAVGWRAHRAA